MPYLLFGLSAASANVFNHRWVVGEGARIESRDIMKILFATIAMILMIYLFVRVSI